MAVNRSSDCVIAGHYWSNSHFNWKTREFEQLPEGAEHCSWCKEYRGMPAKPSVIERLLCFLGVKQKA